MAQGHSDSILAAIRSNPNPGFLDLIREFLKDSLFTIAIT